MLLRPKAIFQFEGLTVLAISVALYARSGESWLLFAALFFVPDLSLAGYVIGNTFGTSLYNFLHTYSLPAILATIAVTMAKTPQPHDVMLAVSFIWAAHIGFDRMLGMSLRTRPDVYGHAQLKRVGRAAS